MKKLFSIFCVFVFLFSVSFVYKAHAEEVPGQMNPYAVIEFDENLKINVIDFGEYTFRRVNIRPYEPLDLSKMTEEQKIAYFEEEKLFKEAEEFTKISGVIEVKIIPEPGMKIVYDGEGFVREVIYPEEVQGYKLIPRWITGSMGIYKWETYKNKIVTRDNSVVETGRFTVLTDKKGERCNVLRKGDCATKRDFDNHRFGQEIQTRKLKRNLSNTNYTHIFYKKDNSSLPNAVLDIWEDGVEYLDGGYSSTTSFMGRYVYYNR